MLSASPALAENWREVSNRDAVVSYIDADAIKRDGDKVRFWVEMRLPEAQTAPTGERFDRIAAMVEINCRTKSYLSLRNRANLGNRLIYQGKTPFASVRTVQPDTPAAAELRAVCFDDWASGK
jgi:hypothetical protein